MRELIFPSTESIFPTKNLPEAEKVGLPWAPPYQSLSKNPNATSMVVTRVSFASGGSGIFNGTGNWLNETSGIFNVTDDIGSFPLTTQVEYYSVVHDQLVQQLGSAGAESHLSKSLFLIVIGSNDLFAYFNKAYNLSQQYTPHQYIDLLISNLKPLIKKMHGLGARKFVVIGVGVIGFTEIKAACCGSGDLNAAMGCLEYYPGTTHCSNRKNHLFWDFVHPTETASVNTIPPMTVINHHPLPPPSSPITATAHYHYHYHSPPPTATAPPLTIKSSNVVLCQSVPGLYIFGDSLIDPGNNNYLSISLARANFPFNGIDFPNEEPTGRFSNGKNAADFLAEKVGLPWAPPYLSLSKNPNATSVVVTGISFASGGSGIFNGTGNWLNDTAGIVNGTDDIGSIPLTMQLEYYSVVHDQLVQQLGSAGAESHLSKSLFLIVIGSNDLFAYFNKASNKMHGLGARKFVVIGVGVIGCCPAQRTLNNNECNADINYWSVKYNDALQSLLTELKSELSDINYSYFHLYDAMNDIIQHPQTYGFTEIKAACCGSGHLNAEMGCLKNYPGTNYCSNRKNHLFWDLFHPTETASEIKAACCGIGNLNAEFPCMKVLLSTVSSNRKNHLFWDLFHPTETTSGIFAGILYNGSGRFTTSMNVEQLVKA
ncbi:hypothetical protein OSB04_un000527 [Centaurea solstitialis]|uniref:GDSL esterase/lipase n=1 Tax=Centaurea solstitialis TaxID=347529 RepID=A0AA38SHV8_9ASTR|nr:hypothetical protein OSB04_un000527 [Centaurea solstitialis]